MNTIRTCSRITEKMAESTAVFKNGPPDIRRLGAQYASCDSMSRSVSQEGKTYDSTVERGVVMHIHRRSDSDHKWGYGNGFQVDVFFDNTNGFLYDAFQIVHASIH